MLNVLIRWKGGKPIRTTCLIDSGSMRTLVNEGFARKLGATLDLKADGSLRRAWEEELAHV